MVAQDANTFVSLARAVALAEAEGAVDTADARDLSAALVSGLLTGCMEMETYASVHEALAKLLEKAFEGEPPAFEPTPALSAERADGPLVVYLEVVGEAWNKVTWEEEACGRLKGFVRDVFDLRRARFGEDGWFAAPLRTSVAGLQKRARAAGLLVLALEGAFPAGSLEAVLRGADEPAAPRVVLGWGDRRVALELRPLTQ